MSRIFLIACCLVLFLTGCSSSQVTPFLPPAAAIQQATALPPTPEPKAMQTQVQTPAPTASPACTNNLTYLQDLSIPDGSQVATGSMLDKRWRVRNSGTCNWDDNYQVKLVDGNELGAKEQSLYPARSGTELTIQVIFTAPNEPGTYQSAWQAYDPQGNPFGDLFYIQIVTQNP